MDLQRIIANLRSPLFLISLTALVVLGLSQTINQQQQQTLLDTRSGHYGNALATLTAKQAANATLNSDLISLQVTLENIIVNPHILSATIHDVENQLLVQAGDSPKLGQYSQDNSTSFTAPITLHDSVAGYVTVTLDNQAILEDQDSGWFIGLFAVCLLVMAFSLMNTPKTAEPKAAAPEDAEPELPNQHAAQHSQSADSVQVTLLLHTLNMEALRKQISGSFRSKLFSDLGKKIDGINMLYSGRIEQADQQWLTLRYSGDNLADASFRASCAALLLFRLLNESSGALQLQLSGAIFQPESKRQLAALLEEAKRTQNCQTLLEGSHPQQLLLCASHHSDSLSQRLHLDQISSDEDWLNVSELQSAYQGLLDKQAQQLNSMLDHL